MGRARPSTQSQSSRPNLHRIIVWAATKSTPDDLVSALPEDEVVVIKDETELASVADAEIAVAANKRDHARALLAAMPRLRWYHAVSAGVDAVVSLPEFRERGILLTNNSGSYDVPIAEHVMSFVFATAKRLYLYRDQQLSRHWDPLDQSELRDSTMVVFGLGSIGGEVARLAGAIGMRVLGVRRSRGGGQVAGVSRVVGPKDLAEVASEADYLVVTAPLTPETVGAVSAQVVEMMRRSAWLINVSRGAIVDEPALTAALRDRRIAGAALDTFSAEPLPADSPLWSLPNVIITPNSSATSSRLKERTASLFLENLRRFKGGIELLNLVDLSAGY
jgi:phosphoglycerate dehydrogenase-like enzyme